MPAIHSMTAFARSQATFEWGALTWEIRSVNHRYLDAQLRLPEPLRHVENTARELMREQLARGKVDCTLRFESRDTAASSLELDEDLVGRLYRACERVDAIASGKLARPGSLDLLRWPGVVTQVGPDLDAIGEESVALFSSALAELGAMREREGARLGDFLEQRLAQVEAIVAGLREALPGIIDAQRQRLAERVAELGAAVDVQRLEQEIVLLAGKADIAEELDRLAAHVEETRRSLRKGGACGRRLDFLMQEFNREANTLSSKSIATATTQAAVELKVLIEQMREQVQNIE